jgi:hypothetical protein
MIPTKIAIATWPSDEARMLPAIVGVRTPYIQTAVANGLTDGVANNVSNTVTTRTWLNQTAAEDWVAFITSVATNNGTTVSVVIEDLPV